VTEINPDAIAIAQQLDAERTAGNLRGPLHGLPMLIKDIIGTADKLNTTDGSYALVGSKLPADSTIAAKLRAAGIIILGKSNLSEWTNFRSSEFTSSNGWSAFGGQTLGAFYPNQDPSGSSSGSAVGVSVGLSFAALGTETIGSLISPAERANLVSIKPTVGLTSRKLVIPLSKNFDTIGPIAKTVKDAARILRIIAGIDPADPATQAQPATVPDYTADLKLSAFQGARIGIPRNVLAIESTSGDLPILAAFALAVGAMALKGATIVDNANFTAYADLKASRANPLTDPINAVLGIDFREGLPSYLSQLTVNPNNIQDLGDVVDYTVDTDPTREEFPQRDVAVFDAALGIPFDSSSPQYQAALGAADFFGNAGGITGVLQAKNLDAVILPSFAAALVPALAGTPVVTVPLGFFPPGTPVITGRGGLVQVAPGQPFGISFLGAKWSEKKLLSFAYAFEQINLAPKLLKPSIKPTAQLKDVV
jgi:amidase